MKRPRITVLIQWTENGWERQLRLTYSICFSIICFCRKHQNLEMQAEVTCDDYRTWRGDNRLPELRTSRLPRIFPHLNSLNSVQSCAKHELFKKKPRLKKATNVERQTLRMMKLVIIVKMTKTNHNCINDNAEKSIVWLKNSSTLKFSI